MDDKTFRRFLLMLLDDANGIREDAYALLVPEMECRGCSDIKDAVDGTDGRCYISEDFASDELAKLG
jgi:hypothetical protein